MSRERLVGIPNKSDRLLPILLELRVRFWRQSYKKEMPKTDKTISQNHLKMQSDQARKAKGCQ